MGLLGRDLHPKRGRFSLPGRILFSAKTKLSRQHLTGYRFTIGISLLRPIPILLGFCKHLLRCDVMYDVTAPQDRQDRTMKRWLFLLVSVGIMMLGTNSGAEPLKVYILAGQSNMVGMAGANTLEHIKMTPDTAYYYADVFDADGKPVVLSDVYISYGTTSEGELDHGKLGPEWGARGKGRNLVGPEYGFGLYMHKALNQPILIIKTAWGGKSLNFDFHPPSAGEWKPPAGHPDLAEPEPAPAPPLPKKLDLPRDYRPPADILPPYPTGRVGKYLGLSKFRGVEVGKVDGAYGIYIASAPTEKFAEKDFKVGDVIVGIDGQGLREDSVEHYRERFYGSMSDDWIVNITRWRNGKLESFDFDISRKLPGGRKDIPKFKADAEKKRKEREKYRGQYYRLMMEEINRVLGDIKAVYPDYDPKQGYELAGFVWFQGWNDMVDGGTYPNRNKPGGYDRYSWLFEHFIRDVRKDLKAPDLPFVIGVLGVDGVIDNPIGSGRHYFRQAMAAPAKSPEFKDTVAAVYTENYWDEKLAKLDVRSSKVGQYRAVLEHRDGLKGEALNKAYAEYRAMYFTPEEEAYLKTGKSNAGFHYLGSGKFMVGAGRAFAEALLELPRKAD
jgi:hypothetical protein